MTTEQWITQLRQTAAQLQDGQALQRAAQSVHAERVNRIFDKGVGGSYNKTKPIWVENSQLRRTNKGKTGKANNTSYFESYYALKADQGFDPNVVNLRLTNDLQSDFANSRVNSGTGKADAGEVIKVNNFLFVEELRSENNVDKLKSLIARFGNFIEFTQREIDEFNRILGQELTDTLMGER